MKAIVLFAVLVAGVAADPQMTNDAALRASQSDVIDVMANAAQLWSNTILSSGLDPLEASNKTFSWEFHPTLLSVNGFTEGLEIVGLSRVLINTLRFPIWSTVLVIDFELPQIEITLGKTGGEITFFGINFPAEISGRILIPRIRIVGEVRYQSNIIMAINMDVSFDGIQSELEAYVSENEVSTRVNEFISNTVNSALLVRKEQFNRYMEAVILGVILGAH